MGRNIKIFVPQNSEIRNRIVKEVSGTEEFDYICNKNEYTFFRTLSEEEFDSLDIHSKEHMTGNVLVYESGAVYVLDGIGYFKVKFEPIMNI